MNIESTSEEIRDLFKMAVLVREKAHCLYSGFKVGAAIRTTQGKMYSGCNVENASYGGSICAERVAIVKAVSELGFLDISDVMVVTESREPWPPCGMCLQVIAEFGKDPMIYYSNINGIFKQAKFSDLLPNAFKRSLLSR
jgi:cytidine deaminase